MKKTQNIYELLNHTPINWEDYETAELNDMEKQQLKKTFRKRNNRKHSWAKIGAVALTLLLTAGLFGQTDWGKNVYAATGSKLSEISYSIGEAFGIERNIAPYANVVNQVVEQNGVEMKLTDVIIDKDELIFSVITNTTQPVTGLRFDYDIFINGKKINKRGGSGSSGPIDDAQTCCFSAYSVDVAGIDTKESLNIKFVLKDLTYYMEDASLDKVKGKWEFEFVADGSELMVDTYVLALAYSFNIGDEKYNLQEFRYNPVNQKIYAQAENRSGTSYDINLKGRDNLGNEVFFYLSRVHGEELIFKYGNRNGDLSNEITSITLAPYAVKFPEESGQLSNDWQPVGEEFTIFLNQ